MALTAVSIDRVVKFTEGLVTTRCYFDGIVDTVVVDGGAASTLTIRKLHGGLPDADTYVFNGTFEECDGIAEGISVCLQKMAMGGYENWAYPPELLPPPEEPEE